ncbi:uncharacterized protein LOC131604113 [Vicia villosa]|uniref:uncharacterized protein LOC131604113 n=1 Tax=Vicia villosa TaxID=3911 RepID=UPI00273B38A1|nr:uncharacterized protein LOC131604113 [Vicia villosa]
MRTDRKIQTFNGKSTLPGRNLMKHQLGGVIFGCTRHTMKECLSKQLFGLPAQHFSYVENINPKMPLFLFNYSDRKLHGVFEATSNGKMFIDPYAWISDDYTDETQYPAQVKVRVQVQCHPLLEDKFGPIIKENYYLNNHFWFELDHRQTSKLMHLFLSPTIVTKTPISHSNSNGKTEYSSPPRKILKKDEFNRPLRTHPIKKEIKHDEKNRVYKKLLEFALKKKNQGLSLIDNVSEAPNENVSEAPNESETKDYRDASLSLKKKEENCRSSFENLYTIVQSVQQRVKERKAFQKTQSSENGDLKQKQVSFEIQHVEDEDIMSRFTNVEKTIIQFLLSKNATKSFQPLNFVGIYTTQVRLKVASTINGHKCFTNIEIFNLDYGRWISINSNSDKKFDLAGMELNDSLHFNGGYNGFDYLKYTMHGIDECTSVPYMDLFDPCFEARMKLMNCLEDFSDAKYFKKSMRLRESKFLKTF